jgi:hypothetical protein
VAQLFQVAQGEQAAVDLLADLAVAAGAGLQLAKVRVIQRQLQAQIAKAAAVRAFGIAKQAGLAAFGRRLSAR